MTTVGTSRRRLELQRSIARIQQNRDWLVQQCQIANENLQVVREEHDEAGAEAEHFGVAVERARRKADRQGWTPVDFSQLGHPGHEHGDIPFEYAAEHARWVTANKRVGPLSAQLGQAEQAASTATTTLAKVEKQLAEWRDELAMLEQAVGAV